MTDITPPAIDTQQEISELIDSTFTLIKNLREIAAALNRIGLYNLAAELNNNAETMLGRAHFASIRLDQGGE